MGLLKRDTERAEIPFERIAALREYVDQQLDLYRKNRQEELAGYSLSPGDSRELVLRFCLENRIYDIFSINCMLNAMGEKELR